MKINLAIYTATEGFDWQPGSAYPRGELNKYKEMIGRFPDILMEKVPYGGIFVCDGKLVFYRLHIAQRGDSRGRDALYCVLGTIPLEAGKKVNLSRVFETPEFRAPMRPFPNSVEIEESLPARPPSTWEEMQDALNSPSSSAQVGVLSTFFSHGKFFCRLDGSVDNPTPRLTYENCDLKPAPKVDVRLPIEVVRAEVAAQPNTAAIERNAYDRARSDFEKRLMAKELDNRRIESENQSLKNIVVILATIIAILLVLGAGMLLFRGCFHESTTPQRTEKRMSVVLDVDGYSQADRADKGEALMKEKMKGPVSVDMVDQMKNHVATRKRGHNDGKSVVDPYAQNVTQEQSHLEEKQTEDVQNQHEKTSRGNVKPGDPTSAAKTELSVKVERHNAINEGRSERGLSGVSPEREESHMEIQVSKCKECGGSGQVTREKPCSRCDGAGKCPKICRIYGGRGVRMIEGGVEYCQRCDGRKNMYYLDTCEKCKGAKVETWNEKCLNCKRRELSTNKKVGL